MLYEIKIDNNGDAREDVTYPVPVQDQVRNPNTFLYNTGPITSLDSAELERAPVLHGHARHWPAAPAARSPVLGQDLPTPPVNVGIRSTPNYDALAAAAVRTCRRVRVFAGQRDDPFFVDLNVFDLLAVPPADTDNTDSLAGTTSTRSRSKCRSPRSPPTARGRRPPTDPNAVIGVWSTASRPSVTIRIGGQEKHSGALRAGLPARPAAGERSRHSARREGPVQFARAHGRRRGAAVRARSRSAEAAVAALRHSVAADAAQ